MRPFLKRSLGGEDASGRIRLLFLASLAACATPVMSTGTPPLEATGSAATPASAPAAPLLYVCVQGEARVDVIDMESLEVVSSVDLMALGFSSNASPHHVAVEPDGRHWYVSLIGENRVARFDRDNRLVATFEMATPGMLAHDAGRELLLVSRSMSAVNPPSRVAIVETTSMEGDELDVFLPRPHPIVVSPDGRWAYTGSLGLNQLAAIDLDTEDVHLTELGGPPHALVQFAVSPDGRWLVAGAELSGRLIVFDRADPAAPRQVASIELGAMVFDPVFSPDGQAVWVPVKGANEVAVVSVAGWSLRARIGAESFLQPHQILFSPDGSRAFVSSNNTADHMAGRAGMAGHEGHAMPGEDQRALGNVTVIDTRSHEVVEVLELGRNVTGLGAAGAG